MSSSTTRFTILVLSCFIVIWHIFAVERSGTTSLHSPVIKETSTKTEDFIQESFEIPVDFCWSTEPIDVVYLLHDDLADSNENWNIDLFKASVKGLSLYLPWIRTIHVFSNHSRTRSLLQSEGNVIIHTDDLFQNLSSISRYFLLMQPSILLLLLGSQSFDLKSHDNYTILKTRQ